MDFEELIRKRHSTRKFSDKIIEKEKIDKILEASRVAPTAKNIQPIHIYVVSSDDGLEKIDKASPCRYGARTVFILCGNKDTCFKKNDVPFYQVDVSIVGTHMLLEATNLGVDSIWIALFNEDVLREEFDIPEELIPVCLIPVGYEDINCPASNFHNVRKNINEFVEYR